MGNINCYKETKKIDEDFNVESIYADKNEKKEHNKSQSEKNKIIKSIKEQEKKKQMITEDFNYSSNLSKNTWRDNILNHKVNKTTKNLMKLIKHVTFRKNQILFHSKFLDDLNEARKDLLGFSQKLLYFYHNFDLIEKNIQEINDKNIKELLFSRTKEDFKSASDFFAHLHKKKELNELIEIDDFKLPIPLDTGDLLEDKYLEKFEMRFKKKFSKIFKLKKIAFNLVHEDPEISFLFLITKEIKKLKFLFEKRTIYIGIDSKENFDGTNLISFVLVRGL